MTNPQTDITDHSHPSRAVCQVCKRRTENMTGRRYITPIGQTITIRSVRPDGRFAVTYDRSPIMFSASVAFIAGCREVTS